MLEGLLGQPELLAVSEISPRHLRAHGVPPPVAPAAVGAALGPGGPAHVAGVLVAREVLLAVAGARTGLDALD